MADVLISYASEDRASARFVADALTAHGWSVWWDRKLVPGDRFAKAIEAELESARCVVVLWSVRSLESHWVQSEAAEARRREILVPAFLQDVEPPLEFRNIHGARLVEWQGDAGDAEFQGLTRAITRSIGEPVKRLVKPVVDYEGAPPRGRPTPIHPDRKRKGVESESIVGRARTVQVRVDAATGLGGSHDSVLTLRIERHDESGDRLQLVPVELRAVRIDGTIEEGDTIRVEGPWRPGTTLKTRRIENLTTGAVVMAGTTRATQFGATWNGCLIAFFFLLLLGAAFAGIAMLFARRN